MSGFSQSSLSRLIRTLKQQYPDSQLVTEFLTYQQHHYAIRALVKMGTTILATGMAADANIEIAEDRAKVRAMEALGIGSTVPQQTTPKPDQKQGSRTSQEVALPHQKQDTLSISTDLSATSTSEGSPPSKPEPSHQPQLPPNTAPSNLSSHRPSLAQESLPPITQDDDVMKVEANPVNVNLLDQIAKTDVEMKRLRWNVDQGRQTLMERYGKRSRRELTDDEVIDFLDYLEKQP